MIKKIINCLFWLPLLANATFVAFHYLPPKALYWHIGILAGIGLVIVAIIFGFYAVIELGFRAKPKGILQRIAFPLWMWHLKRIPIDHPLIDFPYQMQVMVVVPKVFKEKGMIAAQKALQEWLENFPNQASEMIQALVDIKKNKQMEMGGNEDQSQS